MNHSVTWQSHAATFLLFFVRMEQRKKEKRCDHTRLEYRCMFSIESMIMGYDEYVAIMFKNRHRRLMNFLANFSPMFMESDSNHVKELLYSTKHWREKTLADLAVDSQSAKVFSANLLFHHDFVQVLKVKNTSCAMP